MPRFHFNLREGAVLLRDLDGAECSGVAEAEAWALYQARDIMSHDLRDGGLIDLASAIEIEDDNGRRVARVPFTQAVIVRPAD